MLKDLENLIALIRKEFEKGIVYNNIILGDQENSDCCEGSDNPKQKHLCANCQAELENYGDICVECDYDNFPF